MQIVARPSQLAKSRRHGGCTVTVELLAAPLLALAARLSARLDPVRPAADPAAGAGDVRAIGSGNIGATNVLRTGRKGLAAATLLLDVAKGAAAVLLAGAGLAGPAAVPALAAIGALLGHLYPVWLRFRGGKGVATLLGIVARACTGRAALGRRRGLARWRSLLTRYSSVGGHVGGARGAGRGRLLRPRSTSPCCSSASPCSCSGSTAPISTGCSPGPSRGSGGARRPEMPAPADQIARLRLIRSDNIGPVTYFQLLARFGSAAGGARRDSRSRRARRRPRAAARRRGRGRARDRAGRAARRALSVPRPGPLSAACSPSSRPRRRR